MKHVKSITPKAIVGPLSKDMIGKTLFTITGIVSDSFEIITKHDSQTGFKGYFTAITPAGDAFESSAAFLPRQLTDSIVDRLSAADFHSIEIEATIMLVESDKNDRGYAVVAEKPSTKEFVDRVAQIRQQTMKQAQLALGKPANENS